MNRVVLISLALAGCFYTDPINQRPSVAIHWDPTELHRNDMVTFEGVADDPDGDVVAYQWRAYACNQNGDSQTCDTVPSDSGVDHEFNITVPVAFKDQATIAAQLEVNVLHITLEGRDSYGATAKPSQTLDIPVGDAPPTLQLQKQALHAYVVDNDIKISAKVGDPDDVPTSVTLGAWNAIGPAGAGNFVLPTAAVIPPDPDLPPDSTHIQFGSTFHPTLIGDWTIDVVATDPQGVTNEQMLPVHVDADHVPCLAQWDPTATTAPNTTIPITDPTLFQVLVVLDDLDPYPTTSGSTEFHWSIVPPGGMRQQLTSITGAGVALDPDSYTPGDIVELRVEIQDRKHVAVNCPDTDLTCSVISDQSCLQRLTWRVEVR